MIAYSIDLIRNTILKKNYVWFNDDANKGYDVNIVGIRNMDYSNTVTNAFDDFLTISYKLNGNWKFHIWPITTDPGKKSVLEYTNPKGVAILVPDQYLSSYRLGLHQGKYQALCQYKPVKVYRDRDKDLLFDLNVIDTGLFGINIHMAGEDSIFVENWSAGCQVFKRKKNFNEFMQICNMASKIHGNSFSYTLLTTTDFK